jgi:hypothetical protein
MQAGPQFLDFFPFLPYHDEGMIFASAVFSRFFLRVAAKEL